MYVNASGERFTIYCAKATAPDSALRYRSEERSAAFYWVDGKVAYVVSGPADREKLEQVTKQVYEQGDRSAARVVGLLVAPALHQRLELVVQAIGQHNTRGGEQIAGAALGLEALALEAEG